MQLAMVPTKTIALLAYHHLISYSTLQYTHTCICMAFPNKSSTSIKLHTCNCTLTATSNQQESFHRIVYLTSNITFLDRLLLDICSDPFHTHLSSLSS